MTTPIYLDYNATTPIDPAVADAIAGLMQSQRVKSQRSTAAAIAR